MDLKSSGSCVLNMQDRNDILRRLGLNIREARSEKGLSQEELAHKAGLDRSYVGDIERGERNPTVVSLLKLARALGMSVSDFVIDIDS